MSKDLKKFDLLDSLERMNLSMEANNECVYLRIDLLCLLILVSETELRAIHRSKISKRIIVS